MLHGLSKVIPQWVEDRNNDLRQGNLWTIDTLISSVEDHIRHGNKDPVKAFTTIAKQQEEKRVLQRLNQRQNTSKLVNTPGTSQRTPFTLKPPAFCTHCEKDHPGGTDNCWRAHPHLMPDNIKAQRQAQTLQLTNLTANVTVAGSSLNAALTNSTYSTYTYTTIASFVSPTILAQAVANNHYKQRFCYNTAANRHVFNDRSRFIEYTPTKVGNVHGSTGSTIAEGIGTVCFNVVKSDGTTHELYLINVLYCLSFATNVISQAPFKRKGA
jgi:hypothetical protein